MRNEKHSRGPAVYDGSEAPSERACLLIVLRNTATGEQAIWQGEDNYADPDDHHTDVSNAWITAFLLSAGGFPTA